MSYPNHPPVPYYAYYNPQQQVYYPYGYPHHPYAGSYAAAAPVHPQTPIDPSLLSGQQASSSQQDLNKAVPASPTASYDDEDEEEEDEEGHEDRFTLHPVPIPPTEPPSDKEGAETEAVDDGDVDADAVDGDGDEEYQEAAAAGQTRKPRGSLSTPAVTKDSEKPTPAIHPRIPGPIGEVTGAPKQDDRGSLTSDEIAKFNSPVKALNHIDSELFPSRAVFENILYTYQSNLSARKRSKALISRAAYAEIQMTLVEIRESRCRRGTAQYRFWVKKMFGLINFYGHDVVGHQGKPVAIREDIYDILVHCHDQCDHGGRDRTVEVVKDFYRWIPKVIIGEFVKHCPGCSMKRATVKSETSKMPLYAFGDMEEMESMEPDEEEEPFGAQRPPDEMDEDD